MEKSKRVEWKRLETKMAPFYADSLSPFSDLLFYIFFFTKTFFGNLKMDIYNVQISKMENDVQI